MRARSASTSIWKVNSYQDQVKPSTCFLQLFLFNLQKKGGNQPLNNSSTFISYAQLKTFHTPPFLKYYGFFTLKIIVLHRACSGSDPGKLTL